MMGEPGQAVLHPKVDHHSPCIEITTVRNCSVNCAPYCPQMLFREKYGDQKTENFLQFSDFELAISKIPKDVRIVFAGYAEPFLNQRAIDMIELSKKTGHTVSLYSTLVGLRRQDVKRLIPVVDYFCWHAPDNKGIAHIPETDNYKGTLYEMLTTMRIDEQSRMDDTSFFPEDRAGNAEIAEKTRNVRGPFYCSKLIKPQPVMLPNLDLQLCCMDWSLQHKIGSLRDNTFDEIVNGDIFKMISSARWHMSGSELCRGCSMAWNPVKAAAIEVGWSSYQKLYKWARSSAKI